MNPLSAVYSTAYPTSTTIIIFVVHTVVYGAGKGPTVVATAPCTSWTLLTACSPPLLPTASLLAFTMPSVPCGIQVRWSGRLLMMLVFASSLMTVISTLALQHSTTFSIACVLGGGSIVYVILWPIILAKAFDSDARYNTTHTLSSVPATCVLDCSPRWFVCGVVRFGSHLQRLNTIDALNSVQCSDASEEQRMPSHHVTRVKEAL